MHDFQTLFQSKSVHYEMANQTKYKSSNITFQASNSEQGDLFAENICEIYYLKLLWYKSDIVLDMGKIGTILLQSSHAIYKKTDVEFISYIANNLYDNLMKLREYL